MKKAGRRDIRNGCEDMAMTIAKINYDDMEGHKCWR